MTAAQQRSRSCGGSRYSRRSGASSLARGPHRHRYRVLPDTIVEIGDGGDPDAGSQSSGILPDERRINLSRPIPPPVPADPGDPRPVPAGSHSRELGDVPGRMINETLAVGQTGGRRAENPSLQYGDGGKGTKMRNPADLFDEACEFSISGFRIRGNARMRGAFLS